MDVVGPLVSTSWLADNLSRVIPVDATWYLNPDTSLSSKGKGADDWVFDSAQGVKKKEMAKDARKEYQERHIQVHDDTAPLSSRFSILGPTSPNVTTRAHGFLISMKCLIS